jgi:hypothetical protein
VIKAATMNLKEATDILMNMTKSRDNSRKFEDMYRHFSMSDETPLNDYLEFIDRNKVEWLNAFPECVKTESGLRKHVTAVKQLLEHPRVSDIIGRDACNKMKQELTKVWQENKTRLVEERNGGPVQTGGNPIPDAPPPSDVASITDAASEIETTSPQTNIFPDMVSISTQTTSDIEKQLIELEKRYEKLMRFTLNLIEVKKSSESEKKFLEETAKDF